MLDSAVGTPAAITGLNSSFSVSTTARTLSASRVALEEHNSTDLFDQVFLFYEDHTGQVSALFGMSLGISDPPANSTLDWIWSSAGDFSSGILRDAGRPGASFVINGSATGNKFALSGVFTNPISLKVDKEPPLFEVDFVVNSSAMNVEGAVASRTPRTLVNGTN